MTTTTKTQKFLENAAIRLNTFDVYATNSLFVKMINLANGITKEVTEEQINIIFDTLHQHVENAKAEFTKNAEKRLSMPDIASSSPRTMTQEEKQEAATALFGNI